MIVAVNKLDMVEWSEDAYNEICGYVHPFLL